MDLSLSQITYHSRRRDQQQIPILNSGMLYYGNDDNKSKDAKRNTVQNNNNIKTNNTQDEQQQFSYGPIITRVNYNYNKNKDQNINNNSSQSTITKQLYLQNLSNYSYENNNKNNYQSGVINIPSFSNLTNNNKNNYQSGVINMPSFSNLTNHHQLQCQQQQQLHSFRDAYNGNSNNNNSIKDKLNQQHHQQQTQVLREKLKTLTQHLKSSLQTNSEIEQKCNQLKFRLQEKQTKHMNQLSVLKAQLIIRMNQLNEKDLVIGQQNNKLKQLQNKLSQLQQQSQIFKQKYQIQTKRNQSDKKQIQQLKNILIDYQINKDTNINQLTDKLAQKNQQIIELKRQLEQNKQISQQQHNQKLSHIQKIQQQMITNQKTLQQTLSINIKLKQQTEQQRSRINQLNQSIKEICYNSQHLFQEINQVKMENNQLKNKLQERQQQYIQIQQKLVAKQNHLQQLSITNKQIVTKYNTLKQKHTKIQQENIQINTNNTSLLQEIQILNQQIRELKQLCIAQEMKEVQLVRREDEVERKRQVNVMPTRDVKRRLHTQGQLQQRVNSSYNVGTSFDTVRTTTRNDPMLRQQPRFDYLNNQKDLYQPQQSKRQNITTTTFNQPYSHLLSFQLPKQKVHNRLNTSQDVINNYKPTRRRVSTCMDDRKSSVCYDMPLMKDYNLPCYRLTFLTKNNDKYDRRSKSFYVERNNNNDLLISQKQKDFVYRSVIDPNNALMREKQTNRNNNATNSIRSMRHSLDLRQKSLDYSRNGSQQNTIRQQQSMLLLNNSHNSINKSTNTQFQKIYTQNIPQDSSQAKNMFFNKLDKMKLWAKQTVSQGNTQRQALKQINPLLNQQQVKVQNDNYLMKTNRDTSSVQTIIKQKSNLLNQRKNLLTFNLNNQMIQKNILKLQKTNGTQSSKGILRTKQDVITVKENSNLEGLSPIYQQLSNKKSQQEQKLTTVIYQNCKKMLYNHPNK